MGSLVGVKSVLTQGFLLQKHPQVWILGLPQLCGPLHLNTFLNTFHFFVFLEHIADTSWFCLFHLTRVREGGAEPCVPLGVFFFFV